MIRSTGHARILHKSLIVVVFSGLFFRSLSMVELDRWYLFINVYVDSEESLSVSQNGE